MRVLVAEDDLATRRYLEGLLAKWGYHVTSVDDGARACEMLQQEDGPSLALLDWMLPGMDGVDICRRVRSRVRGRPVYLVLLHRPRAAGRRGARTRGGRRRLPYQALRPRRVRSRLRVGERMLDMTEQLQERVSELVQALGRVK